MANEIEKLNTIEIADIEKVNTLSDSDIENLNTLEFTAGPPPWCGSRAVIAGGGDNSVSNDLVRIQYKTVGATANTVNFGDLQSKRGNHACAGSNITLGIFGGGGGRTNGSAISGVKDIDYVTIGSTGNGTDFGDMHAYRNYGGKCGASNGTLLFSCGGWDGITERVLERLDTMEYLTIGTSGSGSNAGELDVEQSGVNATNGNNRYIVNGGYSEAGAIQMMTYNDFSTSANVSDFGNMSAAASGNASVCAASRVVFHVPNNNENRMEYANPASPSYMTTDFGNLTNPRSSATGTSDGTTGEWYGGNDNVGGGHFSINYIDKITIASTSDSSDIGDLLETNRSPGSTSGV